MEAALTLSNGVAASLDLLVAVLIWEQARRLGAGGRRLIVALSAFFFLRAVDRFAAPDAGLFPYSTWLSLVIDVALVATLILLLLELRTLVGAIAARYRRARAHADRDALTGLRTREAWMARLEKEAIRAGRTSKRFAVALIDLDRFRDFNDRNGHMAGDELLVACADAWREQIRHHDSLGRYGGEEFALMLPNCAASVALTIGDRLRESMPQRQTCSVGVAIWDGRESPRDLLRRADQALFRAKTGGRDRVELDRVALGAQASRAELRSRTSPPRG